MAGISGIAQIAVFRDRDRMGGAADRDIAAALREVLAERGAARLMFAAAPSPADTLAALVCEQGIDWRRVTAFHLDE